MKSQLQLDGNKMLYHIPKINKWKRGEVIYPVLIEISPVSYCNQKCLFCAYSYLEAKKTLIKRHRFIELIDEFANLGVKSIFFSGEGEPLLHPNITEFINYAKSRNLDVALNTNGILLTPNLSENILKDLSWVRFSINAGNAESYSRIHCSTTTAFGRLLENLGQAVSIKSKNNLDVTLGVQLVYIGQPFSEIKELANTIKKIGMDYLVIKTFNKHPLISFEPKGPFLSYPELKKIEELSDANFHAAVRELFDPKVMAREYKCCYGLDFFAEIQSDGNLCPCGPLLGLKEYYYGNIYESSFKSIWNGNLRKEVLARIGSAVNISECMDNCRLNSVNNFLWKLKQEPMHVNFI